MELINKTPFVLDSFAVFDKDGAETLVVVLKATYLLESKPVLEVAAEQEPLALADKYNGEPGESGLLIEGEFLSPRLSTGVTLSGHAIAVKPDTRKMRVVVKVGDLIQQAVIYGNRKWKNKLGLPRVSKPEKFDRIPLIWENAFGGSDDTPANDKHNEYCPENPVGRGFRAKKSKMKIDGRLLPNIEHPLHLISNPKDRPPPVGFHPVAPSWQPRLAFAGTYEDKWLEDRAPLLPDDFDERFYQSAPAGLVAQGYLSGGEHCLIDGTTTQGRLEFNLPNARPVFRIQYADDSETIACNLDTVHIDTDVMRLYMVWRGRKVVPGQLELIEGIEAKLGGSS